MSVAVNVVDCGADPTGLNDSAAAFSAAVAAVAMPSRPPMFRHNGKPVHDVGHLLRDRPQLNPAHINGLKRIRTHGPGLKRGWSDE